MDNGGKGKEVSCLVFRFGKCEMKNICIDHHLFLGLMALWVVAAVMIAELLFCSAATGGDFFWVSSVTAIAVVAFFSTNGLGSIIPLPTSILI
ncbi:transmembrane protein, putative [Medicago truncatula]|uniref:Transmembrane protein, putative n=1 Tax=Medicago truncatula TaxID=3880 RepID=A0A072VBH0_MEDTR|nr:transmembrane protein, putative [Medicago truncatula]